MSPFRSVATRLWRWFIKPPTWTPGVWARTAAYALWMTPTIMFSPFLILPLLMDGSDAIETTSEFWTGYLMMFVLPYAVGVAFWTHAHRLDRRS